MRENRIFPGFSNLEALYLEGLLSKSYEIFAPNIEQGFKIVMAQANIFNESGDIPRKVTKRS